MATFSAVETTSEQTSPLATPVHFNWLTELRFFAASAVVCFHIQSLLSLSGVPIPPSSPLLTVCGEQGVQLFFVLSGFLITHLLLRELSTTSDVKIRNFYARRGLRIAPLYYALLMVSLFVVPFVAPTGGKTVLDGWFAQTFNDFAVKLTLFLTFLANLNLVLFPPVMGIAQSWSLSVEEQFYLFWPWLTKIFRKATVVAFTAVLALKVLAQMLVQFALANESAFVARYHIANASFHPLLVNVNSFLYTWHIETLAVGGIAACMLARYPDSVTRFARNPLVAITVLGGLYVLWFVPGIHQPSFYFSDILLSGLVLIFAMTKFAAPKIVRNVLAYGGKTSYGIYMFHPIVCLLAIKLLVVSGMDRANPGFITTTAILTFVGTFLISSLSYEYFERRFLRFKDRFATVPSAM